MYKDTNLCMLQQGSNLGSSLIFPSPNPYYNPTFGSFDIVSNPVWWEPEINITYVWSHLKPSFISANLSLYKKGLE